MDHRANDLIFAASIGYGRNLQIGLEALIADKGYISQALFELLFETGIQLVTGIRKKFFERWNTFLIF